MIHFIESSFNKVKKVVFSKMICGESHNAIMTDGVTGTVDPRKVTCEDCISNMVNYKENMLLSVLMQDFGTNICAKRFRS